MKYCYDRDQRRDEPEGGAGAGAGARSSADPRVEPVAVAGQYEGRDQDRDMGGGWLEMFAKQANIILTCFVIVGYPIVVLPVYRSANTTDWTRFAMACILHPLVHEFAMMLNRLNANFSEKEYKAVLADPKLHFHVLTKMSGAFFLESIFIMYRRTMLGAMSDPRAQVAAIIFTALEEALMRSTLVARDTFFAKLLGRPERSPAEHLCQREIWACSSAMGMYTEFTSIITSRVMYIAFRPHRL